MPNAVPLTLAPTRSVDLALSGAEGSVDVTTGTPELALAIAPILRGLAGKDAARGVAAQASGSAVTIDLSTEKRVYPIVLDANCTISFTGGSSNVDGNPFFVLLEQGGAGDFQALFDGGFLFPASSPSLALSSTPGAVDVVGFLYVQGLGCLYMGLMRGF